MTDDPRQWDAARVDRFAADSDPDDTVQIILELAGQGDADALRVLQLFLGARHDNTYLKAVPSRAAVHALISLGERGARVLQAALVDDDVRRTRYKGVILLALYRASRGERLPWAPAAPRVEAIERLTMSQEAQTAASAAMRDVLAECTVKPELFATVADFIHQGGLDSALQSADSQTDDAGANFGRDVMALIAEASIRLSPSIIGRYEQLLEAGEREEIYQRFLADNPAFLDPLSDVVIPKQRLGVEYATDYAVRRLDGRWLLVEIEKPHDAIFTQAYDFSAGFTHAFGQVLDFQHWVDNNVAYAQRHMTDISAPRGLLVIGMRSALDERAEAKLRQYVENSSRIAVLTFDDLLVAAKNLYANLHRRN